MTGSGSRLQLPAHAHSRRQQWWLKWPGFWIRHWRSVSSLWLLLSPSPHSSHYIQHLGSEPRDGEFSLSLSIFPSRCQGNKWKKKQDVGPGSQHLRPSLELEDWHPREQIHRHLRNSLSPQASGPFCMLLSHFPQLPKESKRCSKKSRSKASFPWDYWLHKSFPSSLGKYYKERVQIRVDHRGPTENLMDINPFYTLVDFAITDISISSCLLSNGFRACDMFQFLLKVIK